MEKRVVIRKNLKESELVDLYQQSKFSMRFGFGEYGLGTSTVESVQNGVPLIINSDLGISDIVKDFSAGLVMDSIDPSSVSDFISKNNNSESYDLLQNNVRKMSQAFSWRKHAENLLIPLRGREE